MLEFFRNNPLKKIFRPFAKREDLYRIMVEKKFDRTIYTPQIKRGDSRFNRWERITKIYGKYYIMEMESESTLTLQECKNHIDEYREQREKEMRLNSVTVEYIPVDTQTS